MQHKIDRRAAAGITTLVVLALLLALLGWFIFGRGDDEATGESQAQITAAAAIAEISATRAAESQASAYTADPGDASGQGATPQSPAAATGASLSTVAPPANSMPVGELIEPLPATDPESFLEDVSETERNCLSEEASADGLTASADALESLTDEERQTLVECLEDDTALRMYLTPVLDETGTLSAQSSACLRSGFAGTDVGTIMPAADGAPAADANTDAEAMMAMAMIGSIVSLSCPSEEEFAIAAPTMNVAPEEYENFQCVLQEVGGPERMAELMHPDAGFPAPLFEAVFGCQVQVSDASSG